MTPCPRTPMPRTIRLLAGLLAWLLAACGSSTPAPTTVSSAAPHSTVAAPSAAVRPVASTTAETPTPSEDVTVRPGEPWIVFEQLADQFDPAADRDGINHDDSVFLVRPDGTGLHRIVPTDFVGSELRPTWSPDGSRVAFIRGHLKNDATELWAINADGTGATMLYRCEGPTKPDGDCNSMDYPDWASDGAIYFGVGGNPPADGGPPSTFQLWRYRFDTGSAGPVITRHDRSIEESRMSPDATKAVYVSYRNLESDAPDDALFVVDLATGHERRITDWATFAAYPDWSIDDVIAFNTRDLRLFPESSVASSLYTIRPDGRNLTELTSPDDRSRRATQPRWSADGRSLLYTVVTPDPGDSFGFRHIWSMDANGGNDRRIAGSVSGTHPELRP
jgi:Tol biopolymer transport system component